MFKAIYTTPTHVAFFNGDKGMAHALDLADLGREESIEILGRLVETYETYRAIGLDANEGAESLIILGRDEIPECFRPALAELDNYYINVIEA